MKRFAFAAALALSTALVQPGLAAPAAPNTMWDLSELYPSPDAWTVAKNKLAADIEKLDSYRGSLDRSADSLLAALNAVSNARRNLDRLSTYASLRNDEDVRISENQMRKQLAQSLAARLGEKTAWMTPEILSLGADKVHAFLAANSELKRRFGFTLENILRNAPHTLGPEAEGVMAAAGDLLAQPDNIYSQLGSGDLPFPAIVLADGTRVARLDQAAYSRLRQSANRDDRRLVFDSFWATWKKFENTFGAVLNTQVLGLEFDAKLRHFPNALADALFTDAMPEAVYRQLVAQANAGLPTFYRYLLLRKRLLGIHDELRYYDMYSSMFPTTNLPHWDVAESERIALLVTQPYGPEYTNLLRRGFAGHWMNVLPTPGKYPGAYMQGAAYDVHPYLLLNHNDDYNSLSTFVHEWGHAVHTMLTTANQPYENANYSTFTAETASISNEFLLADYMVKHARNKAEKLYYLGQELELIRTTFFRQTMFGEFQLALHEEVEKGNALSGARMSEIYCGLLRHYYGEDRGITKIDPGYCVEWAFIPHFYYGFYVYQYATSMVGAAVFTKGIEAGDARTRDRFIAMLKAGGSDYPYDLYRRAGIDMASPAPYQALLARMNNLMDQIERLQRS